MDRRTKEYYEGWHDGIKECIELAEQIGNTYMIDYLKEWLGEY